MYQVICVDNQSTDGTIETIERFSEEQPNIFLVVNPLKGIAGSRNLGLKNAKNDYVAYIDADCIASPNWLSILAQGFERHAKENDNLVAVGGSNIPPQNSSVF